MEKIKTERIFLSNKKTLPDVNIEEYSNEFLMKIWQKGDERSLIDAGTC